MLKSFEQSNLVNNRDLWHQANSKPQTAVCRYAFAVSRYRDFKLQQGVQFSSVQFIFFSQNIIQYKNTYRNCKAAREPRRNQRACESWAPQSQRNKQNKMKFAE